MASLAVLTALCDAITTAHTEFADLVDTLTTQLKPTASKMKKTIMISLLIILQNSVLDQFS